MELDLTEAIEAGWQAIGGSRVRPITLPDPASYAEARDWDEFEENEIAMVEAVVRAAAPIIERAVREQLATMALKHVGWLGPYGIVPGGLDVEPAPNWRRVYVMLTAEERVAIHRGEP